MEPAVLAGTWGYGGGPPAPGGTTEPAVLAGTWGYGGGPPAPGGTTQRRLPVRRGGSAQRTRTPEARQACSEGFSPFLGNA
jgi:hypothetical protein